VGGGCGVKGILNGVSGMASIDYQESGNISGNASKIHSDVNSAALSCGIGQYITPGATACAVCPLGKYSQTLGATFCQSCSSCELGKYTAVYCYSSTPIICDSCTTGKYLSSWSPDTTACDVCPAGMYTPVLIKATTCLNCQAGKYGDQPMATLCTYCSPGTFNINEGSTTPGACVECDVGKYSTVVGANNGNACLSCNSGKFSGQRKSTRCFDCDPGSYSQIGTPDGQAFSQCTTCNNPPIPVLQYQNLPGQVSCKMCDTSKCVLGEIEIGCTATSNKICSKCTQYPNCKYFNAGECFRDGSNIVPACSCAQGFQMDNSDVNKCVQCPPGSWKDLSNYDVCKPWLDASQCKSGTLFIPGTRTQNSQCVEFSSMRAPDNAVMMFSGEVQWMCNAGYENHFS